MKKCPACQAENLDDTKFCRTCGFEIPLQVRCPKCGEVNLSGVSYCGSCGQPLTQAAADRLTREKPREVYAKKKPHGCLTALLICIGVIFIVSVLVASINGYLNKNSTAGNGYPSKSSDVGVGFSGGTTIAIAEATPSTTSTAAKANYIASCEVIDYNDLCRNPNDYVGKRIAVTGQISSYSSGNLAVASGFTLFEDYSLSESSFYQKSWLIDFTQPESNRILKDDIVTFYGTFSGMVDLVIGTDEPKMEAVCYELASKPN